MNPPGIKAADLVTKGATQWVMALADRGIFTTDTRLEICSWNRWLEVHTGIAAADAIGRPLFALFPSIPERGLDRHYAEALSGEGRILAEAFHKYLIPIARNRYAPANPEMAQSVRIMSIRDAGAIIGTISVIDDVTERLARERELRAQISALDQARVLAEEASRLKDEFLATLSHEIRTPLNAVLGWTRILLGDHEVRSREHALEVIERNAVAQLRLVEDLLDTARVISGKLKVNVQTIHLEDVVAAALEVVMPAADAKGITLRASLGEPGASVSGDADRLQQVAWNLISNAVKFTDKGGRVDISVAAAVDGSEVVLTVQDTGQGISPEFLPHVFDRFRQADASASRRHGGLGLGLALARQIVELHGGRIVAASGGPGEGATFTVTLPGIAIRAQGKQHQVAGKPIDLQGLSIVVVEDNDDGREMLVQVLSGYGAEVRAVPTAAEALDVFGDRGFKADLLLSDLGLPGIDGVELIRRLRTSPSKRLRRLPAIAVTAYSNPEDRLKALAAGYQAHLSKPIDTALLVESIDKLGLRPAKARVRPRVRRA